MIILFMASFSHLALGPAVQEDELMEPIMASWFGVGFLGNSICK